MTASTTETLEVGPEDRLVARLAALAVAIHVLEAALPSPLPGLKPGLANVVTLFALLGYGWSTAAWVAGLRVLVSGLVLGTLLSPTFYLSLAGATASVLALGLAIRLAPPGRRWGLGPVGLAVISAWAHISAQFLTAYLLFVPHPGLWHLLPLFLLAATAFGGLSGMILTAVLRAHPELLWSPRNP